MTDPWKQELWDTYGQPQVLSIPTVLRLLGLRERIHPRDAAAFLYPTRAALDAYAKANLERYGLPVLTTLDVPAGVLAVLDLRPSLAEHDLESTDPSLPDGASQ